MSKYGVFSGPCFPVFSPNTGKYRPEETPYLDTFHAMIENNWQYYLLAHLYNFYTYILFSDLFIDSYVYLFMYFLFYSLSYTEKATESKVYDFVINFAFYNNCLIL